jgi:hypothetical protein
MKQTDPNIIKIVSLLAESKHALDKVFEVAKEYQECDQDLHWKRECLQEELDGVADGEDWADEDSVAQAKDDLAKVEVQHALLAGQLAVLCKSLEDELGSAGRVSDHFNKKEYPLGMKPL